jgi:hypothetical protein
LEPAFAIYTSFAVCPLIDVVALSFQDWNGINKHREWVGLRKCCHILYNGPVFWVAVGNTVIWTVMSVVFPPAPGLFRALGLNQKLIARTSLRAICCLPVIIAPIAVATMWRRMYDPFRVRNRFHFGHEDGTLFAPFTTTCYAWTHQPLDQQDQTLKNLECGAFNKLRMCVLSAERFARTPDGRIPGGAAGSVRGGARAARNSSAVLSARFHTAHPRATLRRNRRKTQRGRI